ncbi:MAG: hypothetical protein DDG60_05100 [Anaerolineae bacterium]|nr:MAG: hypothetical protein DDG60_05100 [Anaerolineae bacterium]
MLLPRNPHALPTAQGWRLHLPASAQSAYRYAQIDDYTPLPRHRFLWHPGSSLQVRARLSASELPGTWGFGFWNDPFSFALGLGGMGRRLPCLPNCAWFFYASPENYLSFRANRPANGLLAQTFAAPRLPSLLLAPALLGFPLLFLRPLAQQIRTHLVARLVHEDACQLHLDVTAWHTYRLDWHPNQVVFCIDDQTVFKTHISPQGPLGLVIWMDNQFAAWRPDGSLRAGTLPNPPAWLELTDLHVQP